VKKARFVVKRPQFDFQLFPLFATWDSTALGVFVSYM
jgi:hypothetical protein